MKVLDVEKASPEDYDLAFSALPSEVAKVQEQRYAQKIPVISTASAYRYEPDVPIFLPDVNPKHAKLLKFQKNKRGWEGFICPGPNCTTVGLVVSLKPLIDSFRCQSHPRRLGAIAQRRGREGATHRLALQGERNEERASLHRRRGG